MRFHGITCCLLQQVFYLRYLCRKLVVMKFENANVLITGGASGIGRIMGRMALEKGASCLIIWDINPKNIADAVSELGKKGKVKGYIVDVPRNELVVEG